MVAEKPDSAKPKEAVKSLPLNSDAFTKHNMCDALKVASDTPVQVRYRSGGKWLSPPPLGKGQELSVVFASNPADPCSVPTPSCLQARMSSKSTSMAGHGVDSQATTPAGDKSPCALGLPCGSVLPPTPQWEFRLEDAATQGSWQVRITRGAPPAGVPAQFTAPVSAGLVRANGQQFQPGAVYAYVLSGSDGKLIASGEFEVLAAQRVELLKRLAALRVTRDGLSEKAAWIDALASSQLDWDADQALDGR